MSAWIFAGQCWTSRRRRASKRGSEVPFIEGDALALPFRDRSFEAATIAFGLRNLASVEAGFRELLRVLKPGGRVAVLEFSKPKTPLLRSLFKIYFTKLLPLFGGLISGSKSAYQYLPDSVSRFPDQNELASLMKEAGFEEVSFQNLTGGIAALHLGMRRRNANSRDWLRTTYACNHKSAARRISLRACGCRGHAIHFGFPCGLRSCLSPGRPSIIRFQPHLSRCAMLLSPRIPSIVLFCRDTPECVHSSSINFLPRSGASRSFLLVVWTVVSLVTLLIELVPGDPAVSVLGEQATPEQFEQFRQKHGLDRPPFFFSFPRDAAGQRHFQWHGADNRYTEYWIALLHGDMGRSFRTDRPVTELIIGTLSRHAFEACGSPLS